MSPVQTLEHWIDVSKVLEHYSLDIQNAVKQLIQTKAGQKTLEVLNGDWMGHPLHPVMTDMAIGGYTVAWFLDIIAEIADDESLRKSADDAMLVGLISALGTIITGLADWTHTEGRDRRLGFLHAVTNAAGNSLYLASYLSRHSNRRSRFWFSQLGAIVLTAGAYMGGMLVYREGVGVQSDRKNEKQTRTPALPDVPYSTERYNLP
jgi:uncharacterized membrane protein